MTLEEEILAMESEAAATVASARVEAKNLLSAVDRKREQLAKEVAARLEVEKAGIAEEYGIKLKKRLAEIEMEKGERMLALEESAARKSGDCVKAIMKDLPGA